MAGGYLFTPDQGQEPWLVSYKDPDLMLFGQVDIADAQAALDGDLVQRAYAGRPATVATTLDALQRVADDARQAAQAHTQAGSAWEAETLTELARQVQRLVNRAHAVLEP